MYVYYIVIILVLLRTASSQTILADDQQTDDFEILYEPFPDKIQFFINGSDNYQIINVVCKNTKTLEVTEASQNNICFNLSPCITYQSTVTVAVSQPEEKLDRIIYTDTLYAKPIVEITGCEADIEELTLKWSTINPSCISEYRVELKSIDKTYSWKLENDRFDLLVDGLKPCREHTLQIVGYNIDGEIVGNVSTSNTTLYAEPGNVNITLDSHDNGQVTVSWQEPTYATCVSYYYLRWFIYDCSSGNEKDSSIAEDRILIANATDQIDSNEFNSEVTKDTSICDWSNNITDPNIKSYTISSLGGCELYGLEIYINGETFPKSDPMNFTGPEQVPGSVTIESVEIKQTEMTIYWKAPDINAKCVAFYKVYLIGPVQRSEELQKEYLQSTQNHEYTFTELDPCGQYNLSITTISLNGTLGSFYNSTLETSESKPTAVQNVQIEAEPEALKISWSPPSFGDLCLVSYRLSGWIDETSSSQRFDKETKEPTVTIDGLYACQSYTVQIIPVTSNMDGDPNLFEVETQPKLATANNIQALAQYPYALELSAVDSNFDNKCEIIIARFVCEESKEGNATYKTAKQYVEGQVKGVTFKAVLAPLSPYTSYKCGIALFNTAGWSSTSQTILWTLPYYPDTPSRLALKASSNISLTFGWDPPKYPNGNIKLYISHFMYVEPAYFVPPKCSALDINPDSRETASLQLSFTNLLPYSIYSIQIAAQNEYGVGAYTRSLMVTTQPWVSDAVTIVSVIPEGPYSSDEDYQANVIIEWLLPCKTNGEIDLFIIEFSGQRENYSKHYFKRLVEAEPDVRGVVTYNEANLQPDYNYVFDITVKTKNVEMKSLPSKGSFESPSGIPRKLNEMESSFVSVNAFAAGNPITSAIVRFPINMLTTEWGTILFAALLISEKACNSVPDLRYGAINARVNWPISKTWDEAQKPDANGCFRQYQTTVKHWDPSTSIGENNKSEIVFTIGTEHCPETPICSEFGECDNSEKVYCNGPLKPSTEYYLVLRFLTKSGFNDVMLLEFKTDALFKLTLIGISILCCMLLALMSGVVYIWFTKRLSWKRESYHGIEDSLGDVIGKNFAIYYREVSKPEKILREFKELTSVAMDLSYAAAEVGCNKNRYADIYPYDKNRVILDIDAEGSDYINASFIDGYKRRKEYIATQGPKPESTMDFWRMILQHNVRVIVMVTQFQEGNDVKCHEYFPYNSKGVCANVRRKETFDIYDRTELSVTNEKYGLKQKVVHYYFKKWPDHECPNDPSQLINFLRKVKSERVPSYSPIVVHCSAGVGRTGTFIGLDIIMQRLKYESKINIFETVKKLRFQRMKMVQTLAQYTFLYTCAYELVKNKRIRSTLNTNNDSALEDNIAISNNSRKVNFKDDIN